jgi:uncharacterized protein
VPVFAGSGVDSTSVAAILKIADGAIVGTAFKRDGVTTNSVELDRVRSLIAAASGGRV